MNLFDAFDIPRSTLDDILVIDGVCLHGFSIPAHAADILLVFLLPLSLDGQFVAIGQMDGGSIEERSRHGIFARSRIDGIEAQSGENIPGRKLSTVVIARQAGRFVLIEGPADMLHHLLGLAGQSERII